METKGHLQLELCSTWHFRHSRIQMSIWMTAWASALLSVLRKEIIHAQGFGDVLIYAAVAFDMNQTPTVPARAGKSTVWEGMDG